MTILAGVRFNMGSAAHPTEVCVKSEMISWLLPHLQAQEEAGRSSLQSCCLYGMRGALHSRAQPAGQSLATLAKTKLAWKSRDVFLSADAHQSECGQRIFEWLAGLQHGFRTEMITEDGFCFQNETK